MARLYTDLIKQGLWTIEQIPERWKVEVQEILNQ